MRTRTAVTRAVSGGGGLSFKWLLDGDLLLDLWRAARRPVGADVIDERSLLEPGCRRLGDPEDLSVFALLLNEFDRTGFRPAGANHRDITECLSMVGLHLQKSLLGSVKFM